MEGATRHAHRLANNFLDDIESLQRQSKARDRRAMSHFEARSRSDSATSDGWIRRRRSLSTATPSNYITSSTPYTYYLWPSQQKMDYFGRGVRTSFVPTYVPPVMVGKSMYTNQPTYLSPYTTAYSYAEPPRPRVWYSSIVSHPGNDLPTSTLRASAPPRKNFFSPGAEGYLAYRPSIWRRALSEANLLQDLDEPTPRIVRTTLAHRSPVASARLSSVPPVPYNPYRSLYYSSELGLPSVIPRTYYRTSLSTEEPVRPLYSNIYTATSSRPIHRYGYYPSVATGRSYYSPSGASYHAWSPELQIERRRIQRRMDDVLDYKLPPPEYYREMRGSLRGLTDRLDEHRRMLDRYSGIDMNVAPRSVAEGIESKFQQLASRMGRHTTSTA